MYNILVEPLIRIDTSDRGRVEASLPQVYAALMDDKVEAFPALRPHQRHAWHAFLVQLGAMAMHRAGLDTPPTDADEWLRIIRGLTPDWPDDEPWQLVVDDIKTPAFMQPPANSNNKLAEYTSKLKTPDELDPLVTSRNHDLKSSVAVHNSMDDWVFALIAQQTMGGYSIAGSKAQYHTVSRVNGASGSRVAFSLTASTRIGLHLKRDIMALREICCALREKYDHVFANRGIELVWVEKWDGTTVIDLNQLNPFYIEICRRIRLSSGQDSDCIYGQQVGSKSRRINAQKLNGRVGDPWMPISIEGRSEGALRLTKEDRFGYKQISRCLDPTKYELPPAFVMDSEKNSPTEMFLVARGIVSYPKRPGSGTETWGYVEQAIPLSLKTIRVFGTTTGTQKLGEIAKDRVDQIKRVQDILLDAITTYVVGGKNIYKDLTRRQLADLKKGDSIAIWVANMDRIIESKFFYHLQTEFEEDSIEKRTSIRQEWLKGFVIPNAEAVLVASWESLPCPDSQRLRATATSDNVFKGLINQQFGDFLDQP